MPNLDPNAVAARWAQNLGSAGQRIQQGVDAVTVSPGQAAARQQALYLANVQANAQKWARNVARVGLSDWQQAMKEKGVARIAGGAQAAQPKVAQFLQRFLPYVDSAAASLPPRGTYEQNKARANAMMDKLHQFSNTGA